MITILSGTNRLESNSRRVANTYQEILRDKGLKSQVFDLSSLPPTFMTEDMYGLRTNDTKGIIEKYILSVEHFVFVIPEYNGTFPGALKLFMDAMEPKFFHNKNACLVGVASGRAGNLMGLEQFTTVLNHLQMEVLSNKVLLSKIEMLLGKDGSIEDPVSLQVIDKQIEKFRTVNRL